MGLRGWFRRSSRRQRITCCEDIQQYSSEYMDEELPSSLSEEFRVHMDSCPDCNTFYATFRATVLTLRNLPKRSAPDDLKKRIKARLASESGNSPDSPSSA